MQGVDLIITITDRDRCEDFNAWFRSQGIPLVLTALGQGTATTEILDCLGWRIQRRPCCSAWRPGLPGWCAGRPGSCGWMCPATAF